MQTPPHAPSAVDVIHRDLSAFGRRRAVALVGYLALAALLLGAFLLAPSKKPTLERDGPWMVALALVFAGSALCTAIALGVPLVRRMTAYSLGAVGLASVFAGLFLTVDPTAIGGAPGPQCFAFGSAVSAVAMVALGVVSGRVWRRFPDPTFFIATGVTGVGIAVLHMRCPNGEPLHLFGFHATPLILLFLVTRFVVRARTRLLQDT
ncbi:MAG: hypothetical protein RIT81_37660 [Deltaproteobacteria bacterium]